MSGLREGLGEWASGHGAEVAQRVAAGRHRTRALVARRRRRRTAAVALGAAALVVAVCAVVVIPRAGTLPPASNPVTPIGSLACDQRWTLEPGATTYDAALASSVATPNGAWFKDTDGGDVIKHPDSIWAGFESLRWSGTLPHDDSLAVRAESVAVSEGVIVGADQDNAPGSYTVDGDSVDAYAPYPGTCGQVNVGADDGSYTYHLVITVSEAATGAPIMSFVDPSGSITVEFSELATWFDSARGPYAHLREPVGDVYQAFAVQEPFIDSCTPYADMISRGIPKDSSLMYDVTIPGVTELTNEVWGAQALADVADPNFHPWYRGIDAAVTAEVVDEGNPLTPVMWAPDPLGNWHLLHIDAAVPPIDLPEDCAFRTPIPSIHGAVFLIIDGVDAKRLGELNPGADYSLEGMQTWVYLGQAS